MRVGVSPHLRLLIGRVVAHAAVQREGAVLPLAVLGHVTLEKGTAVRLKAAHVTPGGQVESVCVCVLQSPWKQMQRFLLSAMTLLHAHDFLTHFSLIIMNKSGIILLCWVSLRNKTGRGRRFCSFERFW